MPRLGRVGRQLKSLLWRASIAEEVDAELAFHIEALTRELMETGQSREAARAEAVRRFGDLREVSDTCRRIGEERERDVQRTEYLSDLRHDITIALRQLARSRGFAATAIVTLALGVGATTAIFSITDAV
ncbi:MAG: permease prefix domain 1-containing protein, partial [Gemmatimonadaceae bacterium]